MVGAAEKMTKYLIFGNGYLGNKFNEFLEESILSKIRINSSKDAKKEIKKHNSEFIINCIGKTGNPNIDWCEENKMETLHGNLLVPLYIAIACKELRKKMVHIGSGCIYNGNKKEFTEKDVPNFEGSYYSRTKLISEKILSDFDVLLIRLRMPIDGYPNKRNLLTKLLNYKKIVNYPNSLTVVNDLLKITKELMDKNQTGIFNVVNKNPITHEEILKFYKEISGKKLNYELIDPNSLDQITLAKRSNCVLSTEKLEKLGIEVPEIKEALKKCITQYVKEESK
ncbi:hypothetical protein CXX78_00645 [Candidatus Parvarchaeota archaeon]|nr:MAG: hypothetical protein CXX78_01605 [Candidatus Parvarchaeota archaeon]PXY71505.1 MAG: hypothetical protein CXX78_00645 [Candidatus Parvarchaeota archaeon]